MTGAVPHSIVSISDDPQLRDQITAFDRHRRELRTREKLAFINGRFDTIDTMFPEVTDFGFGRSDPLLLNYVGSMLYACNERARLLNQIDKTFKVEPLAIIWETGKYLYYYSSNGILSSPIDVGKMTITPAPYSISSREFCIYNKALSVFIDRNSIVVAQSRDMSDDDQQQIIQTSLSLPLHWERPSQAFISRRLAADAKRGAAITEQDLDFAATIFGSILRSADPINLAPKIDYRRPITLTSAGDAYYLEVHVLHDKKRVRIDPPNDLTVDPLDRATSHKSFLANGKHYALQVLGTSFCGSSIDDGARKVGRRQASALQRTRPDLPRWASDNRADKLVQMRLSTDFVQAMDAEAAVRGITRTDLVRLAVEKLLDPPKP